MQQSRHSRTKVHVCRPKTSCHRTGLKWLTSLARVLDAPAEGLEAGQHADVKQGLRHSMQFYSIYAETGDHRYLDMCEDFLRQCLTMAR